MPVPIVEVFEVGDDRIKKTVVKSIYCLLLLPLGQRLTGAVGQQSLLLVW